MQISIAALFVIAPNWNQPRCSLTGEQLNKLGYLHNMDDYLVIKIKALLIHKTTWMNLQRDAE